VKEDNDGLVDRLLDLAVGSFGECLRVRLPAKALRLEAKKLHRRRG
jgi:hypothetical protein